MVIQRLVVGVLLAGVLALSAGYISSERTKAVGGTFLPIPSDSRPLVL